MFDGPWSHGVTLLLACQRQSDAVAQLVLQLSLFVVLQLIWSNKHDSSTVKYRPNL